MENENEEVEVVEEPQKFFVLAEDGDCMQDVDVYKFYETNTDRSKLKVEVRRAMVETFYITNGYRETTIIRVTPVRVLLGKKQVDVMADVKTGTLYHKTGECLSSDRRRVIKWEK